MGNYIPEFRERKWKITFPTFGNGIGNEKLILKLWEREWEAGIPGNGQEREFLFPTIPGKTGLPFPFPKFGNAIFHSHSREWIIMSGIEWEWSSTFDIAMDALRIYHGK